MQKPDDCLCRPPVGFLGTLSGQLFISLHIRRATKDTQQMKLEHLPEIMFSLAFDFISRCIIDITVLNTKGISYMSMALKLRFSAARNQATELERN